MVVTLFWSRFRGDMDAAGMADYDAKAARMGELAAQSPGFISIKRYDAADGERLSVVMFEKDADVQAWRANLEHAAVQKYGKENFYERFRLMTLEPLRDREWVAPGAPERPPMGTAPGAAQAAGE